MSKITTIRKVFIAGAIAAISWMGVQTQSLGQSAEYSPYSRFGFGLVEQLHNPVSGGMAGMQATMASSYQFLGGNPASATFLGQTTLQVSSIFNRLRMQQSDQADAGVSFGSPGPMGLIFKRPQGNNALILNLAPFSNSGYAITRTFDATDIGTVQERYDGEGGLSNLNVGWSHAFRSTKFVAAGNQDSIRVQKRAIHVGAQTRYLFGEVRRTSAVDILDPTFLDHRSDVRAQHRSISSQFGIIVDQLLTVQYSALRDFEKSLSLRLGGTFCPETNLISDIERLDETTQTLGGIPVGLDTAFFASRENFQGRMPATWTGGASVQFDRADGLRWSIGLEYGQTQWDQISESLAPEMQSSGMVWVRSDNVRLGMQFNLGNMEQRHPTWGKATYRFGVVAQEQPFEIGGVQLSSRSATAGWTIPLVGSRSLSRIHFGMEIGHRQTSEDGLQEDFYRVHFGASLMPFFKNNWLVKRLYD